MTCYSPQSVEYTALLLSYSQVRCPLWKLAKSTACQMLEIGANRTLPVEYDIGEC